MMLKGYGMVRDLCAELQAFMQEHGFTSIDDFKGGSPMRYVWWRLVCAGPHAASAVRGGWPSLLLFLHRGPPPSPLPTRGQTTPPTSTRAHTKKQHAPSPTLASAGRNPTHIRLPSSQARRCHTSPRTTSWCGCSARRLLQRKQGMWGWPRTTIGRATVLSRRQTPWWPTDDLSVPCHVCVRILIQGLKMEGKRGAGWKGPMWFKHPVRPDSIPGRTCSQQLPPNADGTSWPLHHIAATIPHRTVHAAFHGVCLYPFIPILSCRAVPSPRLPGAAAGPGLCGEGASVRHVDRCGVTNGHAGHGCLHSRGLVFWSMLCGGSGVRAGMDEPVHRWGLRAHLGLHRPGPRHLAEVHGYHGAGAALHHHLHGRAKCFGYRHWYEKIGQCACFRLGSFRG